MKNQTDDNYIRSELARLERETSSAFVLKTRPGDDYIAIIIAENFVVEKHKPTDRICRRVAIGWSLDTIFHEKEARTAASRFPFTSHLAVPWPDDPSQTQLHFCLYHPNESPWLVRKIKADPSELTRNHVSPESIVPLQPNTSFRAIRQEYLITELDTTIVNYTNTTESLEKSFEPDDQNTRSEYHALLHRLNLTIGLLKDLIGEHDLGNLK